MGGIPETEQEASVIETAKSRYCPFRFANITQDRMCVARNCMAWEMGSSSEFGRVTLFGRCGLCGTRIYPDVKNETGDARS